MRLQKLLFALQHPTSLFVYLSACNKTKQSINQNTIPRLMRNYRNIYKILKLWIWQWSERTKNTSTKSQQLNATNRCHIFHPIIRNSIFSLHAVFSTTKQWELRAVTNLVWKKRNSPSAVEHNSAGRVSEREREKEGGREGRKESRRRCWSTYGDFACLRISVGSYYKTRASSCELKMVSDFDWAGK